MMINGQLHNSDEMFYLPKRDGDRLAESIDRLSKSVQDNAISSAVMGADIKNLSVNIVSLEAKITAHDEKIDALKESNLKGKIIREWISKSPKFCCSSILLAVFILSFFGSGGHKEITRYLTTVAKAEYGIN